MLKNIVIVQDYAHINGGNAQVALTTAIALKDMGYRVILFSGMGAIDNQLLAHGIEVKCLGQKDLIHSNKLKGMMQGLWNRKAKHGIEQLLEKLNPAETIIHLHGWNKVLSPSIWEPLTKMRFKVVVTMHDFYLFCPNLGLFNYPQKSICDKRPSSLSCYLCNCDSRNYILKIWRSIRQMIQWYEINRYGKINIIAIGQTNNMLTKRYFTDHIQHIYSINNPVHIHTNQPIDIAKNNVYLFIGRLSTEKGIDLFCRAITELGLKGRVLGDGYLLDTYRKKYPNIDFEGWVPSEKIQEYLTDVKALLFPSLWYEGLPLTPIEMKPYGIPCIVPDKCAAAELITDGKDGYIFKIGDLKSLKECILKLEKANLKTMSTWIIQHFNEHEYSMEQHIEKLVLCYNAILNS